MLFLLYKFCFIRCFFAYCIFCIIQQSVRKTLAMSMYYPPTTSQYTGMIPWRGHSEYTRTPYINNDPNMYGHLQRQDTIETQQDDFYDGYVMPSRQEDAYYQDQHGQESQDDGYIQIQDTPPEDYQGIDNHGHFQRQGIPVQGHGYQGPPEDYQGIDNHGYFQGQGIPVQGHGYQGIQGIKPGYPIPIWRNNLSMRNMDAYAYPNTVTPALSPQTSGAGHILPFRSQSSRPWSPPVQGPPLTRQRSDPNHIYHVSNGFSKLVSNDPEQPKLTAEEEGFYAYKNPRTPGAAKSKDYTSFSIVLFILLGWVGCWICALAGLIYTCKFMSYFI